VEVGWEGAEERREGGTSAPPLASPLTTIGEVQEHLGGEWLDPYMAQVRAPRPPRGAAARLLSCTSPRLLACLPWARRALPTHLAQEVVRVQASALVALDNSSSLHTGMLSTIYRQLTGSRVDPPRYGGHWEDIGFQGTDPATDLRGVGLLGLVQATHLTTTPELVPMARTFLRTSHTTDHQFPLMVLAINLSRMVLHALR